MKQLSYKNGYELLLVSANYAKVHDCSTGEIIYEAPLNYAQDFFNNITE